MSLITLPYRLTAIAVILVMLSGTRGMVITSHYCAGCGTHDYTVSFFGSSTDAEPCCSSGSLGHEREPGQAPSACDDESARSCCSSEPVSPDTPDNRQCCVPENGSDDRLTDRACCEYETELLSIDTSSREPASHNVDLQNHPAITDTGYPVLFRSSSLRPEPGPLNKHGSQYPDLVLKNCCLLT
jgi:hypothetical protein